MEEKFAWCIINTITNYEKKVASDLMLLKEKRNLTDIADVKVPLVKTKSKLGKDQEKPKYPGYVYVKLKVNEDNQPASDIWYTIRNIPGSIGLLKNEDYVLNVDEEEIERTK